MKLKMKWKVCIILFVTIFLMSIFSMIIYNYKLSEVDKNDNTNVIFEIKQGTSTKEIAKMLEDNNLIRNKEIFILYLKLNNINNLQASTYNLKRNMNVKQIVTIISNGEGYNPDEIKITFKEGKNIKNIAKIISENTENSYDDVIAKTNDEDYINSLIDKYWFIDNDINKKGIYYPLEGYLFPNTYLFKNKKVTVEEIFEKMLNETDKVLTKHKDKLESNSYTIHEILTLASIVEKEGKSKDFENIASVFLNRLNKKMELGSCATAYYGVGKDFDEVGIATNKMINDKNSYNTYLISGLPIGPISSISEKSLEAVLKFKNTSYLYFLSDNEGNTYFFKTYREHQSKQKELQNNGKWLR